MGWCAGECSCWVHVLRRARRPSILAVISTAVCRHLQPAPPHRTIPPSLSVSTHTAFSAAVQRVHPRPAHVVLCTALLPLHPISLTPFIAPSNHAPTLQLYNECICDLLAPENTGLKVWGICGAGRATLAFEC